MVEKKKQEKETFVRIGTSLQKDVYDEIKQHGLAYNVLIGLGLQAWKKNPQLVIRIQQLEKDVEHLRSSNARVLDRLQKIEDKNVKEVLR